MRIPLCRWIVATSLVTSLFLTAWAEEKLAGEDTVAIDRSESSLAGMFAGKDKIWSLDLRSSMEYDSNAKLDDGDLGKGDARFIFGLSADVNLPKVKDIETRLGYSLYKDSYDDLDEFDLEGHTLSASFNRNLGEKMFCLLDYSFIYFYFNGDGYLQRHSIAPSFYWSHTDSFATFIRFSWDNNDYVQIDRLSGDTYTLSVREFFYFGPDNKIGLYAQGVIGYNKAVDVSEDFNNYRISLGGGTLLLWKVSLSADLSFFNRRYKGIDDVENVSRRDNGWVFNAALSRPIYKEIVSARLYERYVRQRSSLRVRDYLDNVIGFELAAKF